MERASWVLACHITGGVKDSSSPHTGDLRPRRLVWWLLLKGKIPW